MPSEHKCLKTSDKPVRMPLLCDTSPATLVAKISYRKVIYRVDSRVA